MKTRREEVTQKYWDKIWADIEAFFSQVDENIETSRAMFVDWDLEESGMAISPEEILDKVDDKKDTR